jgi:SAM-dependent methyltransferase
MKEVDYWNKRGKESFLYKEESFYTITPIPYYYRRRRILLQALTKEIEDSLCDQKTMHIHDFGCGDGWYLNYLYKLYPNAKFSGFDISESFIKRAKDILPEHIILSCGDTDHIEHYNLVYSIAVFAHISNEEMLSIFNNIKQMLIRGGKFVIFEQTSGREVAIEGATYIRRLASQYEQIAQEAGFRLKFKFSIDFTIHRFFERYIAKKVYPLFRGNNQTEQRINANKNVLFRALSNFACILSIKPIKKKNKNYWGNTFFCFEKL